MMKVISEPMKQAEKNHLRDLLDGCVELICISNEPIEIVRMLSFGNEFLATLAQHRMLELAKKGDNK